MRAIQSDKVNYAGVGAVWTCSRNARKKLAERQKLASRWSPTHSPSQTLLIPLALAEALHRGWWEWEVMAPADWPWRCQKLTRTNRHTHTHTSVHVRKQTLFCVWCNRQVRKSVNFSHSEMQNECALTWDVCKRRISIIYLCSFTIKAAK